MAMREIRTKAAIMLVSELIEDISRTYSPTVFYTQFRKLLSCIFLCNHPSHGFQI